MCNVPYVTTLVKVPSFYKKAQYKVPSHSSNTYKKLFDGYDFNSEKTIAYDTFLENGKSIKLNDDFDNIEDKYHQPLLRAYTTGTTDTSKQVIHSTMSILGILVQMSSFSVSTEHRMTWLHAILPPSLVAVVISMLLTPLANNNLLILDPFCEPEDIDLDFLIYKPNCIAMIPMFMYVLINSDRIPDDFDMSFLYKIGAGAEPMNNHQIHMAQQFLKKHNCKAMLTNGYGLSEAGSNCVFPNPDFKIENCCYGMPMPNTILAAFDENNNELPYNEIGEICKSGYGNMIGYDNQDATDKVLVTHPDGTKWLHTGDIGYVTEDGAVYILNRGFTRDSDGHLLCAIPLENKVAGIDGVKDLFFLMLEDNDNYIPYLFVILEDGVSVDDIIDDIHNRLEDYEYPRRIIELNERPFFHFKTNRKGLTQQLLDKAI